MFENYNNLRAARHVVRDCYAGADAVKYGPRSNEYLPPSNGEAKQEAEATPNNERTKYRTRRDYGVYENFFRSTINDIVGVMQKNAPELALSEDGDADKVPPELSYLTQYGNAQNDGFKGLKQRLNFGQTLYGRYGLLLDVVADAYGTNAQFCVSEYGADAILDGDVDRSKFGVPRLRWALLDESRRVFNPGTKAWEFATIYRVLGLDAQGTYYQAVLDGDAAQRWGSFDLDAPDRSGAAVVYPTLKGRTLDFIPFTVCNVDRLGIDSWQAPPFVDVARVAIANYQLDSLYKLAIWNFASPTLIVKNVGTQEPVRLGEQLVLSDEASEASLLETSGVGIESIRKAKEEIKSSLKFTSIRDLLDGSGANASAKALSLRADSGTANVAQIDATGGRALEEVLINAAVWLGATVEEACARIAYRPNTSYLADGFQIAQVVQLLGANAADGSPFLSRRNLFKLVDAATGNLLGEYEDNEAEKIDQRETL